MWREGLWMIWVSISLDGTPWGDVGTRAESVARFSYRGLEACTLLARLFLKNFVCSLLTSLCLQLRFFGKFQPGFLCWEEGTMFFCSCLNQRVRTALSLSGVEERLGWADWWHGGNSGYQSERHLRGRPCAHTLLGPFLLCVCGKGEVSERE